MTTNQRTHVYGDGEARINILDLTVMSNRGMKKRDLSVALATVQENQALFIEKWESIMGEVIFEDRQYREATLKGDTERVRTPIPSSVRFDEPSGRMVVEFTNGAAFMVPA